MRDIKVLHVEPTDVCQAACPLCLREIDENFDKDQKHHLTVTQIQSAFDVETIKNLQKMFMCGNYGDPAAGRHTQEIYQYFRSINPNITLGMNTNGALQNTNWWKDLATLFNQPRDYVVFSIDGLEDTNHIYRVNADWNRLVANAQEFIAAGGSAHWDMLVYQHNQHQVDACEQLAKSLGFTWFRAKVSKRPYINQLAAPVGWKTPATVRGIIQCIALKESSMYIDAQGRVSPCCWLGGTQTNFVKDLDAVKVTWNSSNPNKTCLESCGTTDNKTAFHQQWQREVQLR